MVQTIIEPWTTRNSTKPPEELWMHERARSFFCLCLNTSVKNSSQVRHEFCESFNCKEVIDFGKFGFESKAYSVVALLGSGLFSLLYIGHCEASSSGGNDIRGSV